MLRELADADLDSDSVVAKVLEDHGVISWPYFDPATVPADRHERLAHLPMIEEQRRDWWGDRGDGTVEDARWWLKTARALAGTWREAANGGSVADAWLDEGFVGGIDTESAAWMQFTLAMNAGLERFHPRVEYEADLPGGGAFTFGAPRLGLYSAACRQVFNLVVTQPVARRCQNETCGRVFVHQQGGSKYGQHRSTGALKYCSVSCARQQMQRLYRRRKAAKRNQFGTTDLP